MEKYPIDFTNREIQVSFMIRDFWGEKVKETEYHITSNLYHFWQQKRNINYTDPKFTLRMFGITRIVKNWTENGI